jgi:hypothetical protein
VWVWKYKGEGQVPKQGETIHTQTEEKGLAGARRNIRIQH